MLNSLRIALVLFPLTLYQVKAAEQIYITNGEWPPYLSQRLPNFGLASQIVNEAFSAEQVDVRWIFAPWAQSYELAKKGKQWQASALWWDTLEARRDFYFSDEVMKTYNVFYYRKDHIFDWQYFANLKGMIIGVTRGYDYGKEFNAAVAKHDIVLSEVTSDEQNFAMLLKGRIDIFANDPVVGEEQIRLYLIHLSKVIFWLTPNALPSEACI